MMNDDESVQEIIATIKVSSILQGMWDVDDSTTSTSSLAKQFGESDTNEVQQVRQVETRLLQLVDQIPVPDTPNKKKVDGQNFLESPAAKLPVLRPHAFPCNDSYNEMPVVPTLWPQAPIMLRPTPNTQMIIRGIRFANSRTYQNFPGLCAGCILPINTGYERPGQSFVVDFESPLFIGTLLVRVKGAKPISTNTNDETFPPDERTIGDTAVFKTKPTPCYFDGKKRQFQVIVKGRFKKDNIPMSECVTGQAFDRPAGKLPARLILNTFIKFIATLAPQLEVELDSHRPRFLSPLVSTAHTVIAKDYFSETDNNEADETPREDFDDFNMEDDVEEPPSDDPLSVMANLPVAATKHVRAGPTTTIVQRRAARKKAFNRLAAAGDCEHMFNVNKEYTFEFYQHLLLLSEPDDFKINMGHNLQFGLKNALNGQPIKILAARRQPKHSLTDKNGKSSIAEVLWSFDLWHQSLYSNEIGQI